jgi:hypothetical protein
MASCKSGLFYLDGTLLKVHVLLVEVLALPELQQQKLPHFATKPNSGW